MGLLASSTARGHPHSAAETQADMNAAAQADLNVVEARMDSVLAELTKRGAGHSKALAKLNASQSAWRTYRQAMVDASHPASKVEPSETPMCRAWIAERLTKRRIEELLELLHPIEADACHSAWPW
jgi:uncharacterized protein YecT (DUF1311 family)